MNTPANATSLGLFFAGAVGWFLALTVLWMQVSAWTSYPAAGIAHVALGNSAKDWIRSMRKEPGLLQADTRIKVQVLGQAPASQRGELIAEVDPAHYAYGLPLFLALLLAARSPKLIRRAAGGYLLLLIPQAFSMSAELLRQIIMAGGNPAALGIAQWQMEAIALGYQFGSLLLPTLAPTAVWLWLDREFSVGVMLPKMQG